MIIVIGDIVRRMRESSGLSQVQLAIQLKIAQTTLSGYETGYSKPNYEVIERIARICEFDIVFRDKNSGEVIDVRKKH